MQKRGLHCIGTYQSARGRTVLGHQDGLRSNVSILQYKCNKASSDDLRLESNLTIVQHGTDEHVQTKWFWTNSAGSVCKHTMETSSRLAVQGCLHLAVIGGCTAGE